MKFPLTRYGLPQVVLLPAIILVLMLLCLLAGFAFAPAWLVITAQIPLLALLIFVLAFFRDPRRQPPQRNDVLLAPADGRITDIEQVDETNHIMAPAVRIGIFMSIFNAHINRAPCEVKIIGINYKKGKFKDARNPLATKVNESNDLWLVRVKEPTDKLLVRQISGAVARRIVCRAKISDILTAGEKFGMVKFGSRAELYIPASENVETLVSVGDKVKAGLTILARYKKCQG